MITMYKTGLKLHFIVDLHLELIIGWIPTNYRLISVENFMFTMYTAWNDILKFEMKSVAMGMYGHPGIPLLKGT